MNREPLRRESRRFRRTGIESVETRIALLEDDEDDNQDDHDRLRNEISDAVRGLREEIKTFHADVAGIKAVLTGLLVAVTTGAFLVAANLAFLK